MKNIERDIWNAHIRGKIITFNHRAINNNIEFDIWNNIEVNICRTIYNNFIDNIRNLIKENGNPLSKKFGGFL
jgi:hypothetical protein